MISNPGEFQKAWIDKLNLDILRNFPDDFLGDAEYDLLPLPGEPLIKGSEIFGQIEIIDLQGGSVYTSNNPYKIKFILYSNRNIPEAVKIPKDESIIETLVKQYEQHIDELLKEMGQEFLDVFPNSDQFAETANKIFQIINLQRY